MKNIIYKYGIFFLMLGMLVKDLSAQQEAMYSQYMFNTMTLNPAYAGSREVFSMTLLGRAQWIGVEGAPVSQTLSLDAPISNKKIGLGAIIFNDKIGYTNNTGIHGCYAYRMRFFRNTLSMGLKVGVLRYSASLNQAILSTGATTDDIGFQTNVTTWIPSTGAGIYLNSDNYYLGFSIPNLYSIKIARDVSIKVNHYDHMFLMAGFVIKYGDDMKIKPSILTKFVEGAPMEFDLNTNVWFYDVLGVGASYRTGDSFVGMIELQAASNFRIGYAYDYTITNLSNYTSGTHEIILRYELGFGKSKVITPRYF
ncbi:MAG: type IX secretion system membrane protein PorP/SprF [Bacteroidia bacterium]